MASASTDTGPHRRILLLSIRPRFVSGIKSGAKTYELRRLRPNVVPGDVLLIYESSPTKSLVGWSVVRKLLQGTPLGLWRRVGAETGVSFAEFTRYYEGAGVAYALGLNPLRELSQPITLGVLRKQIPGFHPPQSFLYVRREDIDRGNLLAVLAKLLRTHCEEHLWPSLQALIV